LTDALHSNLVKAESNFLDLAVATKRGDAAAEAKLRMAEASRATALSDRDLDVAEVDSARGKSRFVSSRSWRDVGA
jgi:hypothetical protein